MKKFTFSLLVIIILSAQVIYARTFADPETDTAVEKTTTDKPSSDETEDPDSDSDGLHGFKFFAMAGYDFGGTIKMKAESGLISPPEFKTGNSSSFKLEIPYFINNNFAIGPGGTRLMQRYLTGYSDTLDFWAVYCLLRGQYDIPDNPFSLLVQFQIGIHNFNWHGGGSSVVLHSVPLYYSANVGLMYNKRVELRFGYSVFYEKELVIKYEEYDSWGRSEESGNTFTFKYSVFTVAIGYMF